ncbi:glycoside hydrolase family 16 protein [Lentzea sp. NPDC102401]|uniref:beta-glucanase n=1 Tax=Lentzea sp. NPDC102401 TaxID=3364128 RepID=UPI00380BFF6C
MVSFRSRVTAALAAVILGLVGVAVSPAVADAAPLPIGGNFTDNFDWWDTGRWQKADGWTNGSMFNVGWRADHVGFQGGAMGLRLDTTPCPNGCSGRPYASGELRTANFYTYGRFEMRMKAAKSSGAVSGFFTYTGQTDGQPWDEIDIEILGKNPTQMQTNYFTNGTGNHETIINLGFDSSAGFHDYAIEWRQGRIQWFVDGRLVHTENGSRGPLPTHPQRFMANLWAGTGVDGWTGPFNYTGPLNAVYESAKYTAF